MVGELYLNKVVFKTEKKTLKKIKKKNKRVSQLQADSSHEVNRTNRSLHGLGRQLQFNVTVLSRWNQVAWVKEEASLLS